MKRSLLLAVLLASCGGAPAAPASISPSVADACLMQWNRDGRPDTDLPPELDDPATRAALDALRGADLSRVQGALDPALAARVRRARTLGLEGPPLVSSTPVDPAPLAEELHALLARIPADCTPRYVDEAGRLDLQPPFDTTPPENAAELQELAARVAAGKTSTLYCGPCAQLTVTLDDAGRVIAFEPTRSEPASGE